MPRQLRQIAHARSGDKGSNVNIGLIAKNPEDYKLLQEKVTSKKVEAFFKALNPSKVIRYELPNLSALNFILVDVLEGGGSLNLRIDAQGKALGQALLEMPLEDV